MALTNDSLSAPLCSTTANPVSWETSADVTSGSEESADDTFPEQPVQVMPPTEIVVVSDMIGRLD